MDEQEDPEVLRRRRIDEFFEIADRLAALPGPPITEAEVEAEIQAVRLKRKALRSSAVPPKIGTS
jgi:hypothetical protein